VTQKRAAIIVLDGLGIGPAPDTAEYGDAGSDTLGNVARAVGGLKLPNLEKLGLGKCRAGSAIAGLAPGVRPTAAYGIAQPASAGKDSTTGHWEMCGIVLEEAFRTYPKGFPVALLDAFAQRTGRGWWGPNQFVIATRRIPQPAALVEAPHGIDGYVAQLARRMRCPSCAGVLSWATDLATCAACETRFERRGAYWNFVP